jgi:F-type H+-transporting ATPase subunit b
MQVVSTIGLITINETVFIELISFLIFLFLINRIMFRPLRDVMGEREAHIESITSGIEKSKNQLTEMNEQVRAQELKAIKEANQHKKNLEEDGVIQAKNVLDESRKEIQAIKLESQQFINSQISKARVEIKNESQKLAVLIMEKVLDRRLAQ